MENKFFSFIKPYLNIIDNGHFFRKPIQWFYVILAIINLLLPLYFFYLAARNGVFEADGKIILAFIIIWIIIICVSWISFQLWWNRRISVEQSSLPGDEFVAIPIISHLIQTVGEWIGTWIGVVGFLVSLIVTLFIGNNSDYFLFQLGINFLGTGAFSIISMPLAGFFIIVIFRFVGEQFKSFAIIANNTRKGNQNNLDSNN